MNRQNEEKSIYLEKIVKSLGEKFSDHCAGVDRFRSTLEKQLTLKIEKCKDERESAVNDLRKAIARQKYEIELLEKIIEDKNSCLVKYDRQPEDEQRFITHIDIPSILNSIRIGKDVVKSEL
jgi:hypothetical protein